MKRIWPVFVCESLSSVGTSLLMSGIFFYMQQKFGWGLRGNFSLAAAEGAAYVVGSLSAQKIATRFGRRKMLAPVFLVSGLLALACAMVNSPWALAGILVVYTLVISTSWPAIESLATAQVSAGEMSKRVGIYNLVWAGTNTVAFAMSGKIIEQAPAWLFLLPAIVHGISAIVIGWVGADSARIAKPQADRHASATAEAELVASGTIALWLSRICLPSTYVVIYSLMAMMPSLRVMQELSAPQKTVVASIWMQARWVAFLFLGASVWWHTRPRVLLIAGVGMLLSFVGVTIIANLSAMIGWQILLGASLGVIYAGSLYFGMVLSEGSTEHGGYHEALIGLGSVIGPGVGAIVQWRWAGSPTPAVIAVSGVVAISLLAAAIASVRLGARKRDVAAIDALDVQSR